MSGEAAIARRSAVAPFPDPRITPDIRLTICLVLAARRWRSLLDDKLRAIGQSSARMEAMSAIFNSPAPRSQADIAKRLRIEGPTVTRMIDSLTADGLVERHPAPGDRRTKHLTLTAKGEAVLGEMFALADPLRTRLINGMTPDQLNELTELVEGLVDKLDKGLPEPGE